MGSSSLTLKLAASSWKAALHTDVIHPCIDAPSPFSIEKKWQHIASSVPKPWEWWTWARLSQTILGWVSWVSCEFSTCKIIFMQQRWTFFWYAFTDFELGPVELWKAPPFLQKLHPINPFPPRVPPFWSPSLNSWCHSVCQWCQAWSRPAECGDNDPEGRSVEWWWNMCKNAWLWLKSANYGSSQPKCSILWLKSAKGGDKTLNLKLGQNGPNKPREGKCEGTEIVTNKTRLVCRAHNLLHK